MAKKPLVAQLPDIDTQKPLSAHIAKKTKTISVEVMSGTTPSSGNIRVATTAEWNAQPQLVGVQGVVYVYSDHEMSDDGQPIPGFKVGDGNAYLIDAPFNDELGMKHRADTSIHVSPEDRLFWDNKVTAFIDAENPSTLVLTKD